MEKMDGDEDENVGGHSPPTWNLFSFLRAASSFPITYHLIFRQELPNSERVKMKRMNFRG